MADAGFDVLKDRADLLVVDFNAVAARLQPTKTQVHGLR